MHRDGFFLLLLLGLWWGILVHRAEAEAVPHARMTSQDLVIRDGSILRVEWDGFDLYYALVKITIWDIDQPSRRNSWYGTNQMGYSIVRVHDMAVTSNAALEVCTATNFGSTCANLPYYFDIHERVL